MRLATAVENDNTRKKKKGASLRKIYSPKTLQQASPAQVIGLRARPEVEPPVVHPATCFVVVQCLMIGGCVMT